MLWYVICYVMLCYVTHYITSSIFFYIRFFTSNHSFQTFPYIIYIYICGILQHNSLHCVPRSFHTLLCLFSIYLFHSLSSFVYRSHTFSSYGSSPFTFFLYFFIDLCPFFSKIYSCNFQKLIYPYTKPLILLYPPLIPSIFHYKHPEHCHLYELINKPMIKPCILK